MMMHRSRRPREMRLRDFTRPSTIVFRGTHLLRAVFATRSTHVVHKGFYIYIYIYSVLYIILYKLQTPKDNKRMGGCSFEGVWGGEVGRRHWAHCFGNSKDLLFEVCSNLYLLIYILYTSDLMDLWMEPSLSCCSTFDNGIVLCSWR